MKVAQVAFASLLTFASGCGKTKITESPLKPDGSAGTETSAAGAEFFGTWISPCEKDEGDSTSNKADLVITNGALALNNFSYSDVNCASETQIFTGNATIIFGDSVSTLAGAKAVDILLTSLIITARTDDLVSDYNAENVCGGGFVKNTPKTLNAVTCGNDNNMRDLFTESFSVYKVDGNKLYQGNCGETGTATDCSSKTKRPTTFESTYKTKS
jgi:hypothetical protein